jgi:hypothetical protein
MLTAPTKECVMRLAHPWNHGRIIRPKPPLKPKHIWAIRTGLQHEGRIRDLAMFNVAIDGKLPGCDLVRLRLGDVHLGDSIRLRTAIVQPKGEKSRCILRGSQIRFVFRGPIDAAATPELAHGLAWDAALRRHHAFPFWPIRLSANAAGDAPRLRRRDHHHTTVDSA